MGILKRLFGKPTLNRYGWKPDLPDHRDYKFSHHVTTLVETPEVVDHRLFMPPVYNQGDLGSCHDDQTEVLTSTGWKLFKELTGTERLASVNPDTTELIYEIPTRLTKFPYLGYLVCAKTDTLDFKVTPDHVMVVRKWDEQARTLATTYSRVAAGDLGWYSGLLNHVKWNGEGKDTYVLPGVEHKHLPQRKPKEVPMGLWMRFLGIYLAEGTMLKRDQCQGHISYKVQIAGTKPREKNFIRQVLKDLGIKALELSDRFTFENRQLYEAMESLGLMGVKAPQKCVPEMVFLQSAEYIQEFLLGHFMGDGCIVAPNGRCHYTSSSQLAIDLQRLIFLSGMASRITMREARPAMMTGTGRVIQGNYPERRISVRMSNLSIERKKSMFTEPYSGIVYCAEVPTYHTLVTRRNGAILISGNCTANAIGAGFQAVQIKSKQPNWAPSRLMIYYMEREMENTTKEDAGAQIRDGIKVIAKYGVAPEMLWPYDVAKFTQKPPASVYKMASYHQALSYARVDQTQEAMEQCLAQGFDIIAGFAVFSSFESQAVAKTGIMPMPGKHEKDLGGHAIIIVGYDRTKKHFIVRNSWGPTWGDKGYFYMPYDYALNSNLCDDFWAIYTVEDEDGK